LFTGTGSKTEKEASLPISEIGGIIAQINRGETDPENVSPVFAPIIEQIHELTLRAETCKEECNNLITRFQDSEETIKGLKEEINSLASERETYLQDLSTSYTEFDRALEIFQYHEIPMALTGPEKRIHDVNTAFCSLFSIARSEITTTHPPLLTYLPDGFHVTGPDGADYFVLSITPPVVPFDHEAESLVFLLKKVNFPEIFTHPRDEISVAESEKSRKTLSAGIVSDAFDQFPIPAAIINQYRTIVWCNQEFLRLLSREKSSVCLRDIGSCGLALNDFGCVDEVFAGQQPHQCNTTIMHPDGSESDTFIRIIPLTGNPDDPYAMVIGVDISGENEPEEPNDGMKKSGAVIPDSFISMLMDLNPSATALLDSHARVISSNEGFSEITGVSRGDLKGTDVRDLGISIPDSALSSETTEAQYLPRVIRIQSAWGITESSGMVVPTGFSGDDPVAILVLQPIEEPCSQKTQTESFVVQKPEIPDFNRIPVPYLCTDTDGKICQVNEAFLDMTGTRAEQVIGHLREEMVSHGPDNLMNLMVTGKSYTVREIMSPPSENEALHGYWYLDLSREAERTAQCESHLSFLEKELREVKEHQGRSSLSQKEISADLIDIVEFELNQERYAIDITMVREVVEMLPITPLPRTPPYVVGIINLRGEVTHIIDLAILLGERPRKDRSGQKIIIIPSDVTRGEHVGIIVDNVQSVTEILGRHVTLLGEDITSQIRTHIKGIIKISHDDVLDKHAEGSRDATLVIWLDIQKILENIQGTL
jgi:purine-binding chemotaxis protein CheW